MLFEIDRAPVRGGARPGAGAARRGAGAARPRPSAISQRDRPLAEQRAIAQSQLDNDMQRARRGAGRASSAKAAVETAQLNLGFTSVTSLIDGVAAIATRADRRSRRADDAADDGVAARSDQGVLPAQRAGIPRHRRPRQRRRRDRRSSGRRAAGSRWSSPTAASTRKRGAVLAVDREVDPKTGTIRISALFPNPGNVLRPGQYGRVRAQTAVRHDALLVPQRAVTELQSGYQVRVVERRQPGRRSRTVKLGPRVGSRWIVDEGAAAGRARRRRRPAGAGRHGGAARSRTPAPTEDRLSRVPLLHPAARSSRSSSRSSPCSAALVAMRGAADRAVPADRPAADQRHGAPTPAPTRSRSSSRSRRRSSSR